MFSAVSALLFSFSGINLWGIVFALLGLIPIILSFKVKKDALKIGSYIIFFLFFYGYGTIFFQNDQSSLTGKETTFIGSVISEPTLTSNMQWSYEFKLDNKERLQVFTSYDVPAPAFKDRCLFEGELQRPSPNRNPFGFDYADYLYKNGIQWLVRLHKDHITCENSNNKLKGIYELRNKGIEALMSKNIPEASAIMTALVYGDRSFISEKRINTYRQLGTLHLLAVSGLHVGMVTFAMYFILIRFGMTRERASIILMSVLPFYIVLAGGAPSVVRASLMCFFLLFISLLKWRMKAVDLLAIICLSLLIYNPYFLFHLGFQLSFLTSFSLLLSSKLLKEQNRIILVLKVTFVAQLISMPLTLYHFYEISLLTLPVNLLFIPFISLWILPLSFITVIFQIVFPPLAMVSYFLASKSLQTVHYFIDIFSSWKWDMIVFGKPGDIIVLGLILSVVMLFTALEEKNKKYIFLTCVLLICILAIQLFSPYFRTYATVTMLDVGQGDAIVIELPRREGVYLVDTGGVVLWGLWGGGGDITENSNGPGKRVIEPFLKGNGIKKIDKLILTHGHWDHIGEVCYLLTAFPVKQVLYPLSLDIPNSAKKVLQCIYEEQVPVHWAKKGDYWRVTAQGFYIIHPEGNERGENDRSITFIAEIEGVTFLFTGDVEEAGEHKIIQGIENISADILKVGHHGSRTSTSERFIQKVSPRVALISAGRNNRYGHPHQEVTDRLSDHGILTFRTDKHGAVTIKIKKGNLNLEVTVTE
ncbi:competence protein ComEC [Evansella vedderi]|uniref:Competence protein ComEC n=1 Tax=Evansella vedderi TaxID=38282 RepID=A0ABT9ZSW8_9BACI|nr:competence protein ComEC [Evansella vedderi]